MHRSPLSSLQDRIVPPVPQSSVDDDSTYVCLSEVMPAPQARQSPATRENLYSRLLYSKDDPQSASDDLYQHINNLPAQRKLSSTTNNNEMMR